MIMKYDDIVFIAVSDIHLSHNVPAARGNELDWYAVMVRQLQWLSELQNQYHVPIVVAGDLVHTFNQPAELINMAIKYMPQVYAICGQHDQPHHDQGQIHKSAYWTLVEAGRVVHLSQPLEILVKGEKVRFYPFSFGENIVSCPSTDGLCVSVAHRYCWDEGSSYPYALESEHVKNQYAYGYDVMVFGDNHCGFVDRKGNQSVINCGTFYRRSITEKQYKPFVGLVSSTGTVYQEFVPVELDVFMDKVVVNREPDGVLSEFVSYLSEVSITGMNIPDIFAAYMQQHNVSDGVRDEVSRLLSITTI
jgi:predicted phosphodiesterase